MFTKKEEKKILKLARQSIQAVYDGIDLEVDPADLSDKLRESWPVYVAIKKDGQLCGCAGETKTEEPLYINVIKNARNAAFADDRFEQLTLSGWKKGIEIEVSVLSEPGLLAYLVLDDVYEFMNEHQPGVIIEGKKKTAVFLPQIWEKYDDVDEFMGALCKEAGLPKDDWKERKTRILVFEAINIS